MEHWFDPFMYRNDHLLARIKELESQSLELKSQISELKESRDNWRWIAAWIAFACVLLFCAWLWRLIL